LRAKAQDDTSLLIEPLLVEPFCFTRFPMQLLDEATALIPYFSTDNHGELLRLCSIFLLAYLLPYSSGMDYHFTKDITTNFDSKGAETFSIEDYLIQMTLEERLEKVGLLSMTNIRYGSDDFTTVTDQDVDIAFGNLLERISTVLQLRPANSHQVDLLHLFAMMIHPCHSRPFKIQPIQLSTVENSPAWAKAVRLMENSISLQFQIHYGHRRQIVKMMSQCILIQRGIPHYTPLYAGALPHLFSSLHNFCCTASEDLHDAHDSLKAIVSIAVQCRANDCENEDEFGVVRSMYNWLIDQMMEKRIDSICTGHCIGVDTAGPTGILPLKNNCCEYCPYIACGEVLSDLIVLACQSKLENSEFLRSFISTSLAELIEWQVDHWMGYQDDVSPDKSRSGFSPCLMASLLVAAKQVFYFLPTSTSSKGHEGTLDSVDPEGLMILSSISLLRHSDPKIVAASSELLIQAFSAEKYGKIDQFTSSLCENISCSVFQQSVAEPSLVSLVSIISGKSSKAAVKLFDFALTRLSHYDKDADGAVGQQLVIPPTDVIISWFVVIAINCPQAASKYHKQLVQLIADDALSFEARCHVLKALLYRRHTHYFQKEVDLSACAAVDKFLLPESGNFWLHYKIGSHAAVSGNFGLAQNTFRQILDKCDSLDTKQYLWISTLEVVSSAEALLTEVKLKQSSAMGIPAASSKLYSAVSYVETLRKTCSRWKDGAAFQMRFLLLRLDFLDLVTLLRHLTRERRLTRTSPAKSTRSELHVRNVARRFEALACRYHELYRHYGMCFRHSQSITSLAMLQSLSSFMAAATRVCFFDVFTTVKSPAIATSFVKVDDNVIHPMASLLRQLFTLVIQPMAAVEVIDNRIRAAATLELIDGVLLVPFPIPRDFFVPRPSCIPEVLISADPNPMFRSCDETLSTIQAAPAIGFSFYVSGRLSTQYLNRSKAPTWTILLWFKFKYVGPAVLDDSDNIDNTAEDNLSNDDETLYSDIQAGEAHIPDLSGISPVVSSISRNGRFFFEVECPPFTMEGQFLLCSQLGCRDVNGYDWEFPSCPRNVDVQISRSRSIL
jgi:hypothetical protein